VHSFGFPQESGGHSPKDPLWAFEKPLQEIADAAGIDAVAWLGWRGS